jgi:hypothetical protein
MIADLAIFRIAFSRRLHVPGRTDDMQWPVMHVFIKRDGEIGHFWGTELSSNHVDTVLAILEPRGLHAGGSARHSHAAASV